MPGGCPSYVGFQIQVHILFCIRLFPGCGRLLIHIPENHVSAFRFSGRAAERDSSCLVVSRDYYQGLVRVFPVEFVGYIYRAVEIHDVVNHRHCLVVMCGPVNVSSFTHYEKRFAVPDEIHTCC